MTMGSLPAALASAAVVSLVCGGFALMVQAKSIAWIMLLLGIGLAVAAGVSPSFVYVFSALTPFELLTLGSAITGAISLALEQRRVGMGLLWPVISRWLIWPLVKPYIAANWVLIALVAAPFTVFILIWILQRVLAPIYGERAAAHVTGEYLVRAIDTTGEFFGWLINLPFRLLFRPAGPR